MIAVRDRFGVKPLYLAVVNGDVFFASEIKALLALGANRSRAQRAGLLATGRGIATICRLARHPSRNGQGKLKRGHLDANM